MNDGKVRPWRRFRVGLLLLLLFADIIVVVVVFFVFFGGNVELDEEDGDAGVAFVVGRSNTGRRRRCEADNTNSGITLGISRVKRGEVVCVGIAAAAVTAALLNGSTAFVGDGGGGGGGGDTDLVGTEATEVARLTRCDFFSVFHSSLYPATSIMMMTMNCRYCVFFRISECPSYYN